jgi:hypothetical protein
MLIQSNASSDIFYTPHVWRTQISGLHFIGGRNHLHLGTDNLGASFILIERCVFANASSAAILTDDTCHWVVPTPYDIRIYMQHYIEIYIQIPYADITYIKYIYYTIREQVPELTLEWQRELISRQCLDSDDCSQQRILP